MGLIATIASYCKAIEDGRTNANILDYLKDEVVELEDEINGANGPDGVFGEAIDVLVNCVDLIVKERPGVRLGDLEREVEEYAAKKCRKWEAKTNGTYTGEEES